MSIVRVVVVLSSLLYGCGSGPPPEPPRPPPTPEEEWAAFEGFAHANDFKVYVPRRYKAHVGEGEALGLAPELVAPGKTPPTITIVPLPEGYAKFRDSLEQCQKMANATQKGLSATLVRAQISNGWDRKPTCFFDLTDPKGFELKFAALTGPRRSWLVGCRHSPVDGTAIVECDAVVKSFTWRPASTAAPGYSCFQYDDLEGTRDSQCHPTSVCEQNRETSRRSAESEGTMSNFGPCAPVERVWCFPWTNPFCAPTKEACDAQQKRVHKDDPDPSKACTETR